MEYRFEKTPRNYEDFASGKVLYNAKRTTAFPVRLASEIYLRGKSYLQRKTQKSTYTLYDPCCGGAYMLTVLGLLHGGDLERLIGSDVDPKAVELADVPYGNIVHPLQTSSFRPYRNREQKSMAQWLGGCGMRRNELLQTKQRWYNGIDFICARCARRRTADADREDSE